MGISLDPKHLARYRDIAGLLLRYGRSDLVTQAGLDAALRGEDGDAAGTLREAEHLADDLERMGPTYIKLGQLLSTRGDLVPQAYLEVLSRLQDRVEPIPFEVVERVVTAELGARLSRAFQEFDPVPVASASLGQVHRAIMRNGEPVAVKVQRPDIREQVADDLDALEEIAVFVDDHTEMGARYRFAEVLEEFRRTLLAELDYLREARNLTRLAENLEEFESIVVPRPVEAYCTGRVLTMQYIRGKKVTRVSPLRQMEVEGKELAHELFRAYLKQILVDGFFHADPHPGNVFLTDDGCLALLDVGMVGTLGPGMQEQLLRLVLAISEGRGEDVAEVMIRLGTPTEDFDRRGYTRKVVQIIAQQQGMTARELEIGSILMELSRSAGESGLRSAPELAILGKTLLNLDMIGATLDPDFDPNEAIRQYGSEMLQRRLRRAASPAHMVSSLLEANELAQRLPGRVNRVLERIAEDELTIRVNAFSEEKLIRGMQKIANRITVGLIVAALIVGAAMLMHVETRVRIFGYPALAILLFLAAVLGGLALVIEILRHDE